MLRRTAPRFVLGSAARNFEATQGASGDFFGPLILPATVGAIAAYGFYRYTNRDTSRDFAFEPQEHTAGTGLPQSAGTADKHLRTGFFFHNDSEALRRERTAVIGDNVRDKAQQIERAGNGAIAKAEAKWGDAKNFAAKKTDDAKDEIREGYDDAKDQAHGVVDFFKDKANSIKHAFSFEKSSADSLKEDAKAKAKNLKDDAVELKDDAQAKAKSVADDAKAKAKNLKDDAVELKDDAKAKLAELKDDAKSAASDAKTSINATMHNVKESAKDGAEKAGQTLVQPKLTTQAQSNLVAADKTREAAKEATAIREGSHGFVHNAVASVKHAFGMDKKDVYSNLGDKPNQMPRDTAEAWVQTKPKSNGFFGFFKSKNDDVKDLSKDLPHLQDSDERVKAGALQAKKAQLEGTISSKATLTNESAATGISLKNKAGETVAPIANRLVEKSQE